jgi:asparagine synthase (glutamine-hydrolysing)
MRRLRAGILDGDGGAGGSPHWSRLAGEQVRVSVCGPLRVAIEGAEPTGAPLTIFSGVLDNARELAAALGCASTEPDELVAHGYRRYGRGVVARLQGDFSLLIWDEEHGEGVLARDRIGAGGLYLRRDGPRLWFASELADLLAILPNTPGPDRTSVSHWVALSARPSEHTLYEGISRLEPASILTLTRRRAGRSERYWRPRFREPTTRTVPALALELRAGLERAVESRLSSHGRTAVLMSGGLDSASVAALAARRSPQLLACSGVFPAHPQVDESALIVSLRDRLGIDGLTASVQPGGLLASVGEHVTRWRCPPLGWSDFWTLPLLRSAAEAGVTVTLGGDGGDELFGVRAYLLADQLRALHPLSVLSLARSLPGSRALSRRQRARVIASLALAGALGSRAHTTLDRVRGGRRAPSWLTGAARSELHSSDEPHQWKHLDGPRWWAHPAYALTCGIEQAGILEHQRTRAATAGLRARHPLLDPGLLELALSQPPRASFDPELTRPLLREALRGTLPDSIVMRPQKAWFDSLIADCITAEGTATIAALLAGRDSRVREYLRPAAPERALASLSAASGAPRFEAMHLLWRAVGIECWLRSLEGVPPLPSTIRASALRVRIEPSRALRTLPAAATPRRPASTLFPPPQGPLLT